MTSYTISFIWTKKNDAGRCMKKGSYLYSVLIAVFAGLVVSVPVLAVRAANPAEAVAEFFLLPFASRYSVGVLLNTATLFVFAACGMCMSFQSGCFNLGGEGQIYLAGFLTAVLLNRFSFVPPLVLVPLVFAAVFCVCGLTGLFCAVCRVYRNINELLSSFLFSCALIPIIDYLIVDCFRDEKKSLLATPFIADGFRLKSILPPSQLNVSLFFAIALAIAFYCYLYKTKKGYITRVCGKAEEFAEYCGYSVNSEKMRGMFISAGCHGMSGFFAVTGTYFTCHSGFYSGMGWNALSVALMAGANPLLVIPSALVMSYMLVAADQSVLMSGGSFDAANLIQAAVLIAISAHDFAGRKGKK